ncbi:hypothetical protein SLG_01910 [Sphingobium sp. SYK-6]|nr:hypothetical protein SLG_01910 [Sphingobium sp. SYK-6]
MIRKAAMLIAVTAGLGFSAAAQADYFVRPVLQYQGSLQDGIDINGATSNSQTYYDGSTALEAHVDLSDGTIKTLLSRYGPSNNFSGATGVMGDTIRYTGASDVAVAFTYDFNVDLFVDQAFVDDPNDARYLALDVYFAVFEAGTGANWESWTIFSPYGDLALYNDRAFVTFQDEGESFSYNYAGSLGTDLFLESGKSYEVYAAFNLLATPGSMPGEITMDALHTSTIGIVAPGGSFTSESGAFLGFDKTPTPGAVPEPASWAMMIAGFGLIGNTMRRRAGLVMA